MSPRRKYTNGHTSKLSKKLLLLIKAGDVDEVKKFMLFHGNEFVRKICGTGYYIIRLAVENGQSDVARYLMKAGFPVNSTTTRPCKTALYFAVANADLRTVAKLLRRGADTDARLYLGINSHLSGGNLSVLHVAVNAKLTKIVHCLLTFGANVHATCESITLGPVCTPLHLAAENGSELIADFLMQKGASVNAKNGSDVTPLHISVVMNNVNVVLELLRYRAEINIKNYRNGYTALHYSAVYGNREITEILLQQGGNINSTAEYNRTPLKCALHYERIEVAKIITKYVVKMKAEGKHVNNLNDSLIRFNYNPLDFYGKKCEDELFSMKQSAIGKNISFFDVLMAKGNQTVTYARNTEVKRVMDNGQYKVTFPIYGSLIENQINVGEVRYNWIQESISFFGLPYYCVEVISSFLSNIDLDSLVSAAKM